MANEYEAFFYRMDPAHPPAGGSELTVETLTYVDRDNDSFIRPETGDLADGSHVNAVWVDDTITVQYADGSQETITGVTFYLDDADPIFMATDGTILQDATFVESTFVTDSTEIKVTQITPPCFTPGTLILTPTGARPVEQLSVGDRVITRDHGAQRIRWIGRRRMPGRGRFAPIRFMAGALGNTRAMRVSPQHRMLVQGWRAELFFGTEEVLVAAKHLVNGDTIHIDPSDTVEYIHLLFDRHEIIYAEDCPSESFHPGEHIMDSDQAIRDELLAIFPELARDTDREQWAMARSVLKAHEAALLRAAA